MLLHVEYIIVE